RTLRARRTLGPLRPRRSITQVLGGRDLGGVELSIAVGVEPELEGGTAGWANATRAERHEVDDRARAREVNRGPGAGRAFADHELARAPHVPDLTINRRFARWQAA